MADQDKHAIQLSYLIGGFQVSPISAYVYLSPDAQAAGGSFKLAGKPHGGKLLLSIQETILIWFHGYPCKWN